MRDLGRRPVHVDAAVAVGLTVWNQWELTRAEFVDGAVAFNHVAFAVITLSVALRRIAPLGCATVAAVGLTVQTLWGGDVFGAAAQFVALLIATHAGGSHPDRNRRIAGLVVTLFGVECIVLIDDDIVLADEIGNIAVFVAVWALAATVRAGDDRRLLEAAEHDRKERDAIDRERARVARELHDIVAHGLSLMILHAGAARAAPPSASAEVERSLTVVEESGRQAMGELHRLLGMLSGDREATDGMVGLGDLRGLCDRMRDAGLDVTLSDGDVTSGGTIDQSVGLSAYRVVQEALTNALRYAGDAAVTVSLTREGNRLVVVVRDHRRPDSTPRVGDPTIRGEGRGLRGLRERVSLFGGDFSAGEIEGGWQVRAALPIGGVE